MIRELLQAGTPAQEIEEKVMERYNLDTVEEARQVIAIELGDPTASDTYQGGELRVR